MSPSRDFGRRDQLLDSFEIWLHQRLDTRRPAYIIIDALDELEISCRQNLLRVLRSLPHISFKLLVTSRDLPEIGVDLIDSWSIVVSASEPDMATLIRARLLEAALVSGSVEHSDAFACIEDEIVSKITGLANHT